MNQLSTEVEKNVVTIKQDLSSFLYHMRRKKCDNHLRFDKMDCARAYAPHVTGEVAKSSSAHLPIKSSSRVVKNVPEQIT